MERFYSDENPVYFIDCTIVSGCCVCVCETPVFSSLSLHGWRPFPSWKLTVDVIFLHLLSYTNTSASSWLPFPCVTFTHLAFYFVCLTNLSLKQYHNAMLCQLCGVKRSQALRQFTCRMTDSCIFSSSGACSDNWAGCYGCGRVGALLVLCRLKGQRADSV